MLNGVQFCVASDEPFHFNCMVDKINDHCCGHNVPPFLYFSPDAMGDVLK